MLLLDVVVANLILARLACYCQIRHVGFMAHPSSIIKHHDTQLVVVL